MNKEFALKLIKERGDIYVDLRKRTCVYKYKNTETEIELEKLNIASMEEVLERIEELYEEYYRSKTNTYDRKHTYFYAVPFAELTDEDLALGENRKVARANLEMYVLQMLLNGSLKLNKYFWQSKKYPTLIIKRNWFE